MKDILDSVTNGIDIIIGNESAGMLWSNKRGEFVAIDFSPDLAQAKSSFTPPPGYMDWEEMSFFDLINQRSVNIDACTKSRLCHSFVTDTAAIETTSQSGRSAIDALIIVIKYTALAEDKKLKLHTCYQDIRKLKEMTGMLPSDKLIHDNSWARFIAEDNSLSMDIADEVVFFLEKIKNHPSVINPVVWAKGDMARVYFNVCSQNTLPAIEFVDKYYFSANDGIVYASIFGKIVPLSGLTNSKFSGAKTKAAILRLIEDF